MASVCHSVVRAPAARVTRLGACGEVLDSACAYGTTNSFVDITLNKVFQERQDALQLNANGDICVDKPKAPILRWYEVIIQFCNVDPELLNIVSAEPLILNDAVAPQAIGFGSSPASVAASNFALEFWTGTEDEGCSGTSVIYGYGLLPRIVQGVIAPNGPIGNGVVNFTVTGITRGANQWGQGPYNVVTNETGANAGFPTTLLTALPASWHKAFLWTKLAPPIGVCGCQDLTPTVTVAPGAGVSPLLVTLTFPTLPGGASTLPAVIDWGDATPLQTVTAGVNTTHNYVGAGVRNVKYKPLGFSSPTYTATVTVS